MSPQGKSSMILLLDLAAFSLLQLTLGQSHHVTSTALSRGDNSFPRRFGLKEIFDAIVHDPPYGVRAGGCNSGG